MRPARARYRKIDDLVRKMLDDRGYRDPPVDVFAIAQGAGLRIKIADLEDLSVVLKRDGDGTMVVLNKAENSIRHRFAIAHALGHTILHPDLDEHIDIRFTVLGRNSQLSLDKAVQEKEANYFAACLLVPMQSVEAEMRSCPRDEFGEVDVYQLAKKFVVSSNLMLMRICGMENQFSTLPIFSLKPAQGRG